MAVNYKYNILERLQRLPYKTCKRYKKEIPSILKVSPKTFNTWLYIKEDSSQTIKADRLAELSRIFKVSMIELYTTPPQIPQDAFDSLNGDTKTVDFSETPQ
jgi:hypothetical protein